MAFAEPFIVKIASAPTHTGLLEVNDVIAGFGFMFTVAEFVNEEMQPLLLILVSLIVVSTMIPDTVAVP